MPQYDPRAENGRTGAYASAAGTVVATTTLDPATTPIAPGTTIGIPPTDGATGGYQYSALSSVVLLQPNTTYVLVSSQVGFADGYNDGSHDGQMYAGWGEARAPMDAAAAYLGGVTHVSANYSSLNANVTGINIYTYLAGSGNFMVGPVSLQFQLPEPSSLALVGIGATSLVRRGSRRATK